jgi:hypothetical protein
MITRTFLLAAGTSRRGSGSPWVWRRKLKLKA